MITNLSLKVFERMYDRKIASVISTVAGKHITERTVRNWLNKRTRPDDATLEQIHANAQDHLWKHLENRAWPAEASSAFLDGLRACPGFVSGFAFTLQLEDGTLPATVELASKIDLLEHALWKRRSNDDVQGWAQVLLNADWIIDEQLENPDTGASANDIRRQVSEARSWAELDYHAAVFTVNTQFQLLATLDLEFCAAYLADWEAVPLFAALLPRFNPRVDLSGKRTIRAKRNLYHYPTRRLLDATACLRMMRKSPGLKWPQRIPAVSRMVEWLQLADCATLASNVPKWRSGRSLSSERFEALWDACFKFVRDADPPSAPIPMLYAATVFTELFVRGSLAGRDLTFMSPDPAYYRHWWEIQRVALERGPRPPRFGTKQWMPALII